ncbi:MAG: SOS response-associated peptidase [Ktedonobacteraceae bacterium]
MCGRYSLFDTEKMYDRFSVHKSQLVIQIAPLYNVAASEMLPVIVKHSPNQVVVMKWGIIPPWMRKDPKAKPIINAKSETLLEKPTFKRLVTKYRCLIPANGFFEWKTTASGKALYFIHLKHEKIFAFAGLYDIWKDVEGKEFHSFAIITTNPNEIMEPIHTRMPVILPKENEEKWLNPDETNLETLHSLLKPYPSEQMEAYRVSTLVNSASHEGREIIEPI